jgi:hypothetical protein
LRQEHSGFHPRGFSIASNGRIGAGGIVVSRRENDLPGANGGGLPGETLIKNLLEHPEGAKELLRIVEASGGDLQTSVNRVLAVGILKALSCLSQATQLGPDGRKLMAECVLAIQRTKYS